MNPKNRWPRRPGIAALIFAIVAGFTVLTSGQQGGRTANPANSLQVPILSYGHQEGPEDIQGLPDDWTHHHLVFSDPGTEEEAIAKGRHEEWLRIVNDPRYIMQQLRRHAPAQGPAAEYVDKLNEMARAQEASNPEESGVGQLQDSLRLVRDPRPVRPPRAIHSDWSMDMGSSATVGEGQFPAKFSFSTTTANCASASSPDFVAYNTGVAGSSSQASIVAFFNLYTGCSTSTYTVPAVYWAYNTGGTILTSVVVLNSTGTQLAFVHSSGSNTTKSSLVILHWLGGDGVPTSSGSVGANPKTLTPSGTCTGSTTSCEYSVTFDTAANVTRSAPYYDEGSDALYVGDDLGVLHKFTPILSGTPAEVTTGGWPLTVHASDILTAPVFDSTTKNIVVGDSSGRLSYVRDTGSTTGTCSSGSPPCLGSTTETLSTGPIADGPLIDASQGTVYAFSGVTSATAAYEVLQSNESLSTSSSIKFTGVSGRTYTSYMRVGTFDNTYYTSGPSSGHLYVCAPDNDGSSYYNGASLYDIGFNSSGVMNTTASSPLPMVSASITNGATADDCSPLTEFYTGSTDYLFAGVAQNGSMTGCTGSSTAGCLYNFTITSSFPSNSTAGLAATGNTSGIVIDNNVTSPETGEEIYFTNLSSESCAGIGSGSTARGNGTGGCAIQASQSAP
jgi:hypothetical protein